MLEDFRGKCAVVTGAGEGIGREIARALAKSGMNLAILDINAETATQLAEEIQSSGLAAVGIVCDVSLREDVEGAAAQVLSKLGQPSIVWANAGVGSMGGILSMDQANLDWIYEVNVLGMMNTLRAFAGGLRNLEGNRHIGITASVSGLTAIGGYAAAYGATKFAVVGIGEALRAELDGSGIGVTICCPGLVNTRIWNAGKARPERYGGQSLLPEEIGERWRQHGMSPKWIAEMALQTVADGGGYVSPVDPHSLEDFKKRNDEIVGSFRFDPRSTT